MDTAIVLLNVGDIDGAKIMEQLRNFKEVKEAYSVFGVYDFALKVEADDRKTLEDLIVWKIRKIEGVRQTITMWVYAGLEQRPDAVSSTNKR